MANFRPLGLITLRARRIERIVIFVLYPWCNSN